MTAHAICFDLDGTLTDPKPGITRSIRYALEKLGRHAPPEDDLTWCIGPPLLGSFEKLLSGGRDATRALAFDRERYREIGLFENTLYPGIPEVLSELKGSGHRLFVATSKPKIYARRIADYFDLSRYFVTVHGAELDGARSDKTELLRWLLAAEKLDRSSTPMVGDRSFDMTGARNNAMPSLGVLYGYGSKEELLGAGAAELCESPRELAETLVKLGATGGQPC